MYSSSLSLSSNAGASSGIANKMDSVTGYHQTIIIKKAKNGLNIGINNYQECTLSRLFQID